MYVGLPDPTPEGTAGDVGGDNSVKNVNAGVSDVAAGNEASGQSNSLETTTAPADAMYVCMYVCMYV
jgi:hypothetical protein